MANKVNFPSAYGGDGNDYTDDSNASTGLGNGGFRTRLLPLLSNVIAACNWIVAQVTSATQSANAAAASAATALNAPGTSATSTTSLTIASGNQTLTVQTGKLFVVGMFITLASTASPANVMYGTVTSYNSASGALSVSVSYVGGSGTFVAWTVAVSGATGGFAGTAAGAVDEVKGANIASAATVNLEAATGNLVHITGTTAITGITLNSGAERTVVFDGVLVLTNSASLILPGGASITTAAGDSMRVRGDGTGVARVVSYTQANGLPLAALPYLHVRNQQSSGVVSDSLTASTSVTRTLNAVVTNTIAGASLASNQITLPAGTYRIQASAPAYANTTTAANVAHQASLYSVTDASVLLLGTSELATYASSTVNTPSRSFVIGQFTLATAKTICLQHWANKVASGGSATGSGLGEVYSQVEITKVA
jgi:hypothetical protein